MKTQKYWYRQAILYLFIILLVATQSGICSTFSGKVLDSKTNIPIAGVRVSIGFTDTITYTDANGDFSFASISGIRPHKSIKKSESVHIRKVLHNSVIDLSNCLSVNKINLFDLTGRCIYHSDISKFNRIVQLPHTSNGIYVVTLLENKSTRYTFKWNRLNATQSGNFQALYSKDHTSAEASETETVIFQNDFYYPERIIAGTTPQTILMKPDPRAEVFSGKMVGRYDFNMTHEDSLSMEKNALKEDYTPAEFSYNNIICGKVGIRYKGSSYSLPNCFEDDGTRKDKPECHKISFKVKFDEYVDSLRFFKMKKLNLHSESIDPSKMHDILSYALFREMGIISPRCAFAQVFINGNFQGLYCAVEAIDGRFTEARWPQDGDGNLYKEKWPINATASYYKGGLETNDKPEDSADVSRMIAFYEAVHNSDQSTFKNLVSPFLDFDYWLHYIAVDRVIHNSDGIMTWYNQPNWVSNHNYFFYQPTAADARFWIIPWDLHVTFAKKDQIVDVLGVPDWNVAPPDCEPVTIWGNQSGFPAHCDKLTGMTADLMWDNFVKVSEKMLDTYFDVKYLQNKIDNYKNLIDTVIRKDPHVDYNTWVGQVNTLRSDVAALNSDFDDYIHGKTVLNDTTEYLKPFEGTGFLVTDKLNNFEFQPTGNIKGWTDYFSSTNTTISLIHDTLNPLWGKADLLYSFVFDTASGDGKYLEWARINANFEKTTDLRSLKEIQVNLKTDINREFWMFIVSPEYSKNNVSVEYGWWDGTMSKDSLRVFKINTIAYAPWASGNPPDLLEKVLAGAKGIGFQSNALFNADGELLSPPDSGFLRIDNIRFVFK